MHSHHVWHRLRGHALCGWAFNIWAAFRVKGRDVAWGWAGRSRQAVPQLAGCHAGKRPLLFPTLPAVVTDERTGIKYPLADYALTPNMVGRGWGLASSLPLHAPEVHVPSLK